ncbi:SsgA family sporulation/cell division regulator [Streptomyces sp. NPDC101225]|uniref:SsgA family sporulation/cell division regulator n=1 Tax=Streptomyces sp. NPDC101225 TaxID=3366135 RepID=UPI0038292CA8
MHTDDRGKPELDALVAGRMSLGEGALHTCDVQMRFSPNDPLVVRLSASRMDPLEGGLHCGLCVVSRDLLRAGLDRPTGIGKVHVMPLVLPDRPLQLAVLIRGQGQEFKVVLDHQAVVLYLKRTAAIVPFGKETAAIDIDREIDELLGDDD